MTCTVSQIALLLLIYVSCRIPYSIENSNLFALKIISDLLSFLLQIKFDSLLLISYYFIDSLCHNDHIQLGTILGTPFSGSDIPTPILHSPYSNMNKKHQQCGDEREYIVLSLGSEESWRERWGKYLATSHQQQLNSASTQSHYQLLEHNSNTGSK